MHYQITIHFDNRLVISVNRFEHAGSEYVGVKCGEVEFIGTQATMEHFCMETIRKLRETPEVEVSHDEKELWF